MMSPKPPEEPEQTGYPLLIDEVIQLSELILEESKQGFSAELNQLILKRGMLTQQLNGLDLQTLPSEARMHFNQKLEACAALEKAILQNLRTTQQDIENQLRSLKEAHNLLDKYKHPLPPEQSTRNQEA